MRIPAVLAAVASVLVVVLITREMGGGRLAQTLCAWAYAFAATPLLMGHVLLTASLDLVLWPLVCLFVLRAIRRSQPRWWLAVGAGIAIVGPRRVLWSRWVLLAAVLAAVIALPNLLYQATHSWPQIAMGRALSENNAGEVRVIMWPYLLLLLGPPLVPIWVAGLVALQSRPAWRPVRFLVPAFGVLLIETFAGGGQLYYPVGLLAVIFAVGCVPSADFLQRSSTWRRVTVAGIALNAAVSGVIALPVLKAEQSTTVILASNYGEAGAIIRYGPAHGLPCPFSGHNQLYFDARPPDSTQTAVVIGGQLDVAQAQFTSCTVRARLRNAAGVDNEEEGQPVAICRGPRHGWATMWPEFQHYD